MITDIHEYWLSSLLINISFKTLSSLVMDHHGHKTLCKQSLICLVFDFVKTRHPSAITYHARL